MFTAIGLYIVVIINGEECIEAEKAYTKDIVVESGCYKGTFKLKG